jgi:microcystin-dependent protein
MRVADNTLRGGSNDRLVVIRGALATRQSSHDSQSLIKKIEPKAIEFHRPSIIRASGHTFEYLGYGPGNYSTGLPQVQVKSLPEREEFFVQSQERSAGIVVYTGMNNRGDFFIGNQRKSASTGEETTFDTPIPTITGEDPSRLSVVFDEVIIKERLVVEGGASNQILSQFDGPVTFNERTRFTNINKITNKTDSTSTTSGALVVTGGVGIGKTVRIGGDLHLRDNRSIFFGNSDDFSISHIANFSSQLDSFGNLIAPSSATVIEDNGPGPIVFKSNGGGGEGAFQFFDETWNPKLKLYSGDNQGAILYHGNTGEKLRTLSDGVDITGTLNVTGVTDGANIIGTLDVTGDTTIVGDLDLTGSPSNSGILSANYLAVPNISPIGSIMMWPGSLNKLPNSPFDYWIPCNGATLSATAYPELFAILGYKYGGTDDNFNVPDMRNLFVTGAGDTYNLSATGGSATVTLTKAQMPVHTHGMDEKGSHTHGTNKNKAWAGRVDPGVSVAFAGEGIGDVDMNPAGNHKHTITSAGGSGSPAQTQPHENRPPYIALYYIIRIQ